MSKKRKRPKNDNETGVFKNSPFKTLKGFAPGIPAQKPPEPKKTAKPDDAEDAGLFFRSMDGVRRVLDGEDAAEPQVPPLSPSRPADTDRHHDIPDQDLFLEAMGSLGTTALPAGEFEPEATGPARSGSSRMRQLRKGTIRISDELDLHGYLKDEALRRLERFITSAHARRQQAVLVITGKGLNSPEGPVLPGAVAAWLREQGKGMVAEFMPAPRDKGGSGAYVVFLKRERRAAKEVNNLE
ncbi:MAG: Smr/MutS family protein [Nitrospirota bacterium]